MTAAHTFRHRYPMRPITVAKPKRHTHLGPAEIRLLDDWGKALRSTFPEAFGAYLVGSSLVRPDYRDIDVRIILPEPVWLHLDEAMKVRRLNLMLTLWGRQVTGLNIDCQVQSQGFANVHYGKLPRNPLGIRNDDGEEGA